MRSESIEAIKGLVGEELGISDWFAIDQARITAFADATEDHNSVHIDPAVGEAWGLGGTIAHGFLTLSLILKFSDAIVPMPASLTRGFNYGLESVRFLAPVRCGKRVRGRFVLRSFTETKPGNWRIETGVTIEIEGEDKPALSALWIALAIVE